jgi:F0F1-type ATP synthase assembly protein I
MGFTMAAVMLLMIWGGYKLDEHFDKKPVFTIILTLLSIPVALYLSLKDLLKKKK